MSFYRKKEVSMFIMLWYSLINVYTRHTLVGILTHYREYTFNSI